MNNYLAKAYDVLEYYIHWFTDRPYIDAISNLNDELVKRFNYSLTYTKSMQLYNTVGNIKSHDLSFAVGQDSLGGPIIAIISEEGQTLVLFSLCFCCSKLGLIEDKRKR